MPSISELGVGVGDRVRFTTRPHTPIDRDLTLQEFVAFRNETPDILVEGEIVALDEEGVYIHPFREELGAFREVQNTNTGEIYPPRAQIIGGQIILAPLNEGERYVLALDRRANIFTAVQSPQNPNK